MRDTLGTVDGSVHYVGDDWLCPVQLDVVCLVNGRVMSHIVQVRVQTGDLYVTILMLYKWTNRAQQIESLVTILSLQRIRTVTLHSSHHFHCTMYKLKKSQILFCSLSSTMWITTIYVSLFRNNHVKNGNCSTLFIPIHTCLLCLITNQDGNSRVSC